MSTMKMLGRSSNSQLGGTLADIYGTLARTTVKRPLGVGGAGPNKRSLLGNLTLTVRHGTVWGQPTYLRYGCPNRPRYETTIKPSPAIVRLSSKQTAFVGNSLIANGIKT